MERAARRLTPVSLELGGKDPMIVLDDADIDLAAHAAVWGAMFNAGQTCVSVERVYVLDSVYDQFVKAVVRDVQSLQVGAGEGKTVGALIDEQQLAVTERHVREAVAAGARALTGGQRTTTSGSFYPPTVLVNVDHSMACMTEETFGPDAADHEGRFGLRSGPAGQRQSVRAERLGVLSGRRSGRKCCTAT